jgi:acyl-CoA thioesterase FadM
MADELPRPEDFRFTTTVDLGQGDVGFHVNNLEMTELLFKGRNSYLTAALGVDWQAWIGAGRNLVIRQVVIDFLGEVREPTILVIGVRARSRRRRSITLDEAVWIAGTGEIVARGRSIHIAVSVDPPAAIELPAELVARAEEVEGEPVPVEA